LPELCVFHEDLINGGQLKQFEMSPMTLDQATEQLLLTDHEFFMFKNVDKGSEINVVYRRKSGGVACITP
jgi:hypothetical protein